MIASGLALLALAYLLGSVPFGVLVVRRYGRGDLRSRGSGNIGATNVLRTAGLLPGIATLFLDAGKGAAVALVAGAWMGGTSWPDAAALAATVGHVYPPWLRFRGGRGVATAGGAFGVLHPVPMLGAVVVFVACVAISRRASVGSLLAAAAFVAADLGRGAPRSEVACVLGACTLILWAHRDNLARLVRGEEPRIRVTKLGERE